ncbi:hypothetical protein [Candidatus Protochlamydia phocaeensis]|uniref:hypothetical protein n=1 Tax=Candidatus Protochlamydia phocaeensis TaxID=1414722 RepID=UPI0012AB324E|nr:hypothetical protein [Candidatus Protochlamydia phocaeensis]
MMIKKAIRNFFIFAMGLTACANGLGALEPVDQITYDTLANSPWTDHVRAFRKLFELEKVNSFFEFGLGLGTKYFLDSCPQVTSIELVVKDRAQYIVPWYYDCVSLFQRYSNWTPILYEFSDTVNAANQLALLNLNPELFDASYLNEIRQLCQGIFTTIHYDVAFVDAGIHIRGDLVNALFGYVDIIAAHDTNSNHACYGWYKINPPDNYEQITSTYGCGITFWIKKDKQNLINQLKFSLLTP